MGCPTGLVTAVAVVITSPGALLTPASKMAPFLHFLSAGGVLKQKDVSAWYKVGIFRLLLDPSDE